VKIQSLISIALHFHGSYRFEARFAGRSHATSSPVR